MKLTHNTSRLIIQASTLHCVAAHVRHRKLANTFVCKWSYVLRYVTRTLRYVTSVVKSKGCLITCMRVRANWLFCILIGQILTSDRLQKTTTLTGSLLCGKSSSFSVRYPDNSFAPTCSSSSSVRDGAATEESASSVPTRQYGAYSPNNALAIS